MVTGTSVVALEPRKPSDDSFVFQLSERVFAPYSLFPAASMAAMLEEPFAVTMIARTTGPLRGRDGSTRSSTGPRFSRGEAVGFFVLGLEPYGRPYGPIASPLLARLNAIAVVPECQGSGIGSFLLDGALRLSRAHAALSISLMTAIVNRAARRLFDHRGFRALCAVEGAYAKNQRALIMSKVL
jgi:ribosomal protein S18 acetylase RimI-like enzyme